MTPRVVKGCTRETQRRFKRGERQVSCVAVRLPLDCDQTTTLRPRVATVRRERGGAGAAGTRRAHLLVREGGGVERDAPHRDRLRELARELARRAEEGEAVEAQLAAQPPKIAHLMMRMRMNQTSTRPHAAQPPKVSHRVMMMNE